MPSLPSKPIFPSWCLPEDIEVEDQFSTTIQSATGAESRNADWSESRRSIDISGSMVTSGQRRTIRMFVAAVRGRWKLCLFRRYNDDDWELLGPDGQGELLGIGDGARKAFQARIYDEYQSLPVTQTVRWLDHDIPVLGKNVNGQDATKTRQAEVFLGGVKQTSGYVVARETGVISFAVAPAAGVQVRLRCGFFVCVRLDQEGISMKPAGNSWYRVGKNVQLVEPKGQVS